MSQTQQSTAVGSRFAMGNTETLRVGGHGLANPPMMLCYRPRMNESDLVSNLERYVSKNGMSSLAAAVTNNTSSN